MSRQIVLVGDTIDHGGRVVEGSADDLVDGRAIARQGDLVECSRHGRTRIAEGCPTARLAGRPIALDGHKTECGATLMGRSGVFVE